MTDDLISRRIHQPYSRLEIGDRVLRLVDGVHGTVTEVRSQWDYTVAWDRPEEKFVHLMTGSSTVRCGAPMRDPEHPDGWDLGDVTVGVGVTCSECLP